MIKITLFSQIIQSLDRQLFKKAVERYGTDKHNKGINSWSHMVTMLFCQFSKAQSLREITNGIRSVNGNLNHLGIQKKVPRRSSLSYINEHRDWRMFREYYYFLKEKLEKTGNFQRRKFKEINKKIYLLDSTIISLCLKVFDWARYTQEKGAIKLHTMLDYDGCLPSYIFMTEAKQSDVRHARYMTVPKNSVIVADRGYQNFKTLYQWHKEENVTFVIRLKKTIKYSSVKEMPLPDEKDENILKDELILLTEESTRKNYPEKLRRVAAYDAKNNQEIELITNNFTWEASTIAELYKQRWMIEIFFKELKQHLKIKSFIGTNQNAMLIQIWTAVITLMILKYLKQIAKFDWSLSNLIAFLRMNLFVKTDLIYWLDKPFNPPGEDEILSDQTELFAL